jgi:hypothetical protein
MSKKRGRWKMSKKRGRWKQKLAQPKEVLMKLNLARNPIESVSFAKTRWDEKGLSINPSETFLDYTTWRNVISSLTVLRRLV